VSCKPPRLRTLFDFTCPGQAGAVLGPSCVFPPRSSNANSLWRPDLAEPRRVITTSQIHGGRTDIGVRVLSAHHSHVRRTPIRRAISRDRAPVNRHNAPPAALAVGLRAHALSAALRCRPLGRRFRREAFVRLEGLRTEVGTEFAQLASLSEVVLVCSFGVLALHLD
jgi:hypothetical protein